MKNQRLFHLISIAVIFVFIVSLFTTVNVLADDGTPPAPTEEPVQPPTEESTPEQALSEEPSDEGEPDSTSTPEADSETTPAEILDSVPESVDVVVLDENGQAMALTTEEAADIILAGDPVWCPDDLDGTPQDNPTPGANGCTDAATTFTQLLINLNGGSYSGNGTIFVAWDYASSESEIVFDHSDPELNGLGNLTIQGGWVVGTGVDTSLQSTLNGTWLSIYNWGGAITINNIFIQNAASDGLYIQTTGDVNLTDVDVDNSDLSGAWIESGGDVTVTNSGFTDNGKEGYWDADSYEAAEGLYIDASEDVTLNNVYAYENGGHGAVIYGQNVMITNGGFSDNGWGEDDGYGAFWYYSEDYGSDWFEYYESVQGGNGLNVYSNNDITILEVCACGNAMYGAYLEAGGDIQITNSDFNSNGGLGDADIEFGFEGDDASDYDAYFEFESHAGDGIYAEADGDITLIDVVASGNANNGAYFESYTGDVNITDSSFDGNGWGDGVFEEDGLGYDWLEDYLVGDGDDDAFCEILDENYLSFESFIFNPCTDNDYVEVYYPNFQYYIDSFNNGVSQNSYEADLWGGQGLEVYADGTITVNGVSASGNAVDGAHFHGDGDISVTDGEFSGNGELGELAYGECLKEGYDFCGDSPVNGTLGFAYGARLEFDYGNGLYVDSYDGSVTLSDVNVNGNGDDGAIVYANGSVFVEDSDFNGNGYPIYIGGEGGLFGFFLYDVYGFDELELPFSELEDMGFDLASDDIDIFGGSTFLHLRGGAEFSSGAGLDIDAYGNVTLKDISASGNLGDGVSVDTNSNLFVTDSNFNGNGWGISGGLGGELYLSDTDEFIDAGFEIYNGDGLYADVSGDITLSNVAASGNSLYGAELYSGAVNSVFIEDSQFNSNGNSGALGTGIWVGGYIYDDGAEYEEDGFEYYGSGLYIESAGDVKLIEVEANGNYFDGAEVYSNGGRVIVSCGQYDGNNEYGIYEDGASSLELYGPEVLGNGNSPDEYFFSGSLILSDDCTIPEEKSTAQNGKVVVKCDGLSENATFALPSGDFAIFPCPINDSAFIQQITEDELPGGLADGQKFLSALKTHLTKDGSSVDENDRSMKISFLIPEEVDKETLAILYWNGTEWMDLGGEVSVDGLYFEISTNFVGTFVLVSK